MLGKNYFINRILAAAIILIFFGIISCKKDNNLEESLANQEDLLNAAKFISYNLNYSTKQKGIYKLSVSGTQAFSSSYWGWEEPTSFLEGGNRIVSLIKTFDTPFPDQFNEHSFNFPFADGTFSDSRAYTGIVRPKNLTASSRIKYDTNGDQTADTSETSHTVSYDTQTDDLESCTVYILDASGDLAKVNRFAFAEDPRLYSSYYTSGYAKFQGVSATRVGSVNIEIQADPTAVNYTETFTYKMFDETGTLGSFDASGDLGPLPATTFNAVNGTDVIKIVIAVVHYPTAVGSIAANSIVTTTTKYSDDTTAIYREVVTTEYEDFDLRQRKNHINLAYTVSNNVQTLSSRNVKTYTKGFETGESVYTVSSGNASLSYTTETTRDAQGRKTLFVKKTSSGKIIYQEDYTFDSTGRTESVRSYDVNATTSAQTCNNTSNKDYTYESTLDSSGQPIRIISEDAYTCSGTTLNSDPGTRISRTYNMVGQLLLTQNFNYVAESYLLTSQLGYEYNSSWAQTRIQNYSVAAGTATTSSHTLYGYDSNLFRISTISYDASGNISAEYFVYTYTYK